VVALAHELGKNVVIEGVETEDDVSLLRAIGCEYGQGSFYGEPMSEREVIALLKIARRAERRLSKRSGLLRKRPIPTEAPLPAAMAARPGPSAPESTRPMNAPQVAVADGANPPPLPASRMSRGARSAQQTAAQAEAAKAAGPPPLPITRPSESANGGVHLSLPPTPLRPGSPPEPSPGAPEPDAAAPAAAGPPPLPSAPASQASAPAEPPLAAARPPPLPAQAGDPPPTKPSSLPPAIAERLAQLAGAPRK
jgi:hypothetical protein